MNRSSDNRSEMEGITTPAPMVAPPRSRPKSGSSPEKASIVLDVLLPLAVSALFLFPLLGRRLLEDWDEAIYAEIAREFVKGTSWLVPHWSFQPWFEKPPLLEWITATFFSLFGVSEFWARATSVFAGMGTVLIAYSLARRLGSRPLAWLTLALLLTTRSFCETSRFGSTDSLLTLFMWVSLYGLWLVADEHPAGWFVFWCGLGLGIMTKSAAATPIVLTALALTLIDKRFRRYPGRPFWYGLVLFILIVAPWHVYMTVHFGRPFLNEYVGRHILARSLQPLENHTGGKLFYVTILSGAFWPWVFAVPFAALRIIWDRRMSLIACFALVVLCFYTLIRTKLYWYITPIYPALAIMAAYELHQALRRWEWIIPVLVSCVLVFGLFVLTPFWKVGFKSRPDIALIRQNDTRVLPGPLILCSDQVVMEKPAMLFYSHRKVEQAYIYSMPLEAAFNDGPIDLKTKDRKYYNPIPFYKLIGGTPALAIIDGRLVSKLPADVDFRPIAANADYELGTLARAR